MSSDIEIPDCFYRVSAKALVLDPTRTKFLIVLENNGKWELPGGGIAWGETPQVSLAREIEEEMGIQVTRIAPNPAYFFAVPTTVKYRWVGNLLFETELPHLNFRPSEECQDLRFVAPEEVRDLVCFSNVTKLAEQFDSKRHWVAKER